MEDNTNIDSLLYDEAKIAVIKTGNSSASFLQRTFRLGHARASALIDLLEKRGVVGEQNGAEPREVLIKLYAPHKLQPLHRDVREGFNK